jgi:deoxyribonuclease V
MNPHLPSQWLYPSSLEEAALSQKQMAEALILTDDFSSADLIGGMDVSNDLHNPQIVYAAAIVIDAHSLKIKGEGTACQTQTFPYISGFLGFREAPALIEAFKTLTERPHIFMMDGHGWSHPRRLGIASHLGILLDISTIGVAKSILVGHPASELGENRGDRTPLIWKGEKIGMLLRTKTRCNPLIISTGHRVSLDTAVELVLQCLTRYRLPEPTRQAHLAANRLRFDKKLLADSNHLFRKSDDAD